MDFNGKVVLITGAGQGIGRAFAHAFAEKGAFVAAADLFEEKAEKVLKEIIDAGGNGMAAKVDVSDEISANTLVEKIVKEKGRLDVLVNNAAVFSTIVMKPFDEISVSEWDKVMMVNCRGVFVMSKAVIGVMKEQKKGKIVNIGAAAVVNGRPEYLHYVASKSSLLGFTRSLSKEVGKWGITVNNVMPGGTHTEVQRDSMSEAHAQTRVAQMALGRKQVPEDLTGPVMFFSSPYSDFVTGQTLIVDGGINFL